MYLIELLFPVSDNIRNFTANKCNASSHFKATKAPSKVPPETWQLHPKTNLAFDQNRQSFLPHSPLRGLYTIRTVGDWRTY